MNGISFGKFTFRFRFWYETGLKVYGSLGLGFEKQQQEKTGTEFSNLHAKHKMAFRADPVIIAMVSVVKGQVLRCLTSLPVT